jgi:hypothetical protein
MWVLGIYCKKVARKREIGKKEEKNNNKISKPQ